MGSEDVVNVVPLAADASGWRTRRALALGMCAIGGIPLLVLMVEGAALASLAPMVLFNAAAGVAQIRMALRGRRAHPRLELSAEALVVQQPAYLRNPLVVPWGMVGGICVDDLGGIQPHLTLPDVVHGFSSERLDLLILFRTPVDLGRSPRFFPILDGSLRPRRNARVRGLLGELEDRDAAMRSFAAAKVPRTTFGPEVERWAAPAEQGLRDAARFVLRRSQPSGTARIDPARYSAGTGVRNEGVPAPLFGDQGQARAWRRNKALMDWMLAPMGLLIPIIGLLPASLFVPWMFGIVAFLASWFALMVKRHLLLVRIAKQSAGVDWRSAADRGAALSMTHKRLESPEGQAELALRTGTTQDVLTAKQRTVRLVGLGAAGLGVVVLLLFMVRVALLET